MKIKFNVQETIQKEYEFDNLDSKKVIRRAEQIKTEAIKAIQDREYYPTSFWYECAIQELLKANEIVANLVDQESEKDITSAWIEKEEEDS